MAKPAAAKPAAAKPTGFDPTKAKISELRDFVKSNVVYVKGNKTRKQSYVEAIEEWKKANGKAPVVKPAVAKPAVAKPAVAKPAVAKPEVVKLSNTDLANKISSGTDLTKALKSHIVDELSKGDGYLLSKAKKVKDLYPDLEEHEAFALASWTSKYFSTFNSSLVGYDDPLRNDSDNPFSRGSKLREATAIALDKALSKLPKPSYAQKEKQIDFEASYASSDYPLLRGLNVDDNLKKIVESQYKANVGKEVEIGTFFATSYDKNHSRRFANGFFEPGKGTPVEINIRPRKDSAGKEVDSVKYAAFESEILFSPKTKFKITEYRETDKGIEVFMEEVGAGPLHSKDSVTSTQKLKTILDQDEPDLEEFVKASRQLQLEAKNLREEEKGGNALLKAAYKASGYDGLPGVVSKSELDSDPNLTNALRRFGNSKEEFNQFFDNFKNGDYFAGNGIYGDGTYIASNKSFSKMEGDVSLHAREGGAIRLAYDESKMNIKSREEMKELENKMNVLINGKPDPKLTLEDLTDLSYERFGPSSFPFLDTPFSDYYVDKVDLLFDDGDKKSFTISTDTGKTKVVTAVKRPDGKEGFMLEDLPDYPDLFSGSKGFDIDSIQDTLRSLGDGEAYTLFSLINKEFRNGADIGLESKYFNDVLNAMSRQKDATVNTILAVIAGVDMIDLTEYSENYRILLNRSKVKVQDEEYKM